VSTKDFQVYTKRPKTTHTYHRFGEEETQYTKIVEGECTPFLPRSYQAMSTSSSKKQTNTTVITQPPPGSVKLSIFEKYDLIKKKKQILTNNSYAQF